MKILYAADNRYGSFFQLKRFIDSIKNLNIELKISTYQKSLGTLDSDYNLDCLLNFTNPDASFSKNGNYDYYKNEIKRFSPDLIISDLEIYSSLIALEEDIELWQVSPLLIYYALPFDIRYRIGINKTYSFLLNKNINKNKQLNYIIANSNKKFVVSHLCDTNKNIKLNGGFDWIRPDFVLAETDQNYFNFMVVEQNNNKNIINSLKDTKSTLFFYNYNEIYDNIKIFNILDEIKYGVALEKYKTIITDGMSSFVSDAFYNQKSILFDVDYKDIESVLISNINSYFGIGKIIHNLSETDSIFPEKIVINNDIKFLHEEIKLL